jgi:hypothetical protein
MQRFQFASIALAASGIGLALAVPAQAQLINSSFATQASISVAPTIIETTARGASASMSGSNLTEVTLPVIDNDGAITVGVAGWGTSATGPEDGTAFTFSQSVNPLDATEAVQIENGLVAATPEYSNYTITAGGVAGLLEATLTSAGAATITAGGVGTTASLLQQVSLTVFK